MLSNNKDLALTILERIFKRRKLVDSDNQQSEPLEFSALPASETQHHLKKIEYLLAGNQAIHMILPAYPGKSPNRNKTLSKLPDLSEEQSIDNLAILCQEIKAVYPPGARIAICSDGYVFSDLVRIPDEDVKAYTDIIQAYYQKNFPDFFEFYDIKDTFPTLTCLDSMREELMVQCGESLIALMEKAREEKQTLAMYKGITRFLFEDFCGLEEFSGFSKAQIQKLAKQVSLRVIQRSNAWSQLLERNYPHSLRLSIHPQFRQSEKIGIQIVPSEDCWRTPWHSVAVKHGNKISLQKRSYVDESRFRLIFSGGRPSHYQQLPYLAGENDNA